MSKLIFKNYKFRCSSLGHLMTNLDTITDKQLSELSELEQRYLDSFDNPKRILTENMQKRFLELKAKRDAEDVLPTGAKTYLDSVFRDVFWKRKVILTNKFLDKGLLTEQDILDLASKLDDEFYTKNDLQGENDFIQGSWDNFKNDIVRDTKSNFSLETFENAELTSQYNWQLKGYSWIIKEQEKLDFYPKAELIYGLVNSPLHIIKNEINSLYYKMDSPNEDNENFILAKQQIERNHIFDVALFQRDYPFYIFENEMMDFSIPSILRIKKFNIETNQEDIEHIKRRVLMSRIYLCQKEIDVNNKLKT